MWYWIWIIVACLLSLVGLVTFVVNGWIYLFGGPYTKEGQRDHAVFSTIGFGSMIVAWLWPIVLPVAFLVALVFIVRGAFKADEA